MTQKTALILSVVLTAFLLVAGGGIIARVSQPEVVPTAAPAAAPAVALPAIDMTAQLQDLMQQRETQYRQLIDQANQRLAAVNQQLAAAQAAQSSPASARSVQAAPAARAAQPAQPVINLSAEAARNIALNAANLATMIREPELVRFEGKVAYEVDFTRGVVYVDASSGAVLFNGTQGNGGGQSVSQSSSGDDHGGQHDDEHDDDHGDDHD